MRLQFSTFPFAGTQHFNNLSSIFGISDIAIRPAAVTPEHTSAVEVDTLWEASNLRKYAPRGMFKNIIYIHNLQMLKVHITVLPK